jgi:glutathione synthase
MDPIETIDIRGDSTFALLLEGQARGHEIFYYLPDALSLAGSRLIAEGQDLQVEDKQGQHATLGEMRTVDLKDMDVVHLRQDPPFDISYITTTHLLEKLQPDTLVVNDPGHVRNAPEKIFVTEFMQFMPDTLITKSRAEVLKFRAQHGDIILKPLYGNGGAAIFRIAEADENLGALLEMFETIFREPFIVQQYLPAVRQGDKRIILVDGVFAGAINRIPEVGESRSNLHVGGRPEATELTDKEHEICETVGPHLEERGLIFVGIDVIGDKLTEINVTSPTGIREIKKFGGPDIAALIWDAIERRRGA